MVRLAVAALVKGLAELGGVQADVTGQPCQDRRVADVEAVAEEGFEDVVVVLGPPAVVAGELKPLPGEVRVRLRRYLRQVDLGPEPFGQRVDGPGPRLLQVIAVRSQGRLRLGPQLERPPFDLDVFARDCLRQRKLRQVAIRSDEIRVDADRDGHDGSP
jgi:hypothetical protein